MDKKALAIPGVSLLPALWAENQRAAWLARYPMRPGSTPSCDARASRWSCCGWSISSNIPTAPPKPPCADRPRLTGSHRRSNFRPAVADRRPPALRVPRELARRHSSRVAKCDGRSGCADRRRAADRSSFTRAPRCIVLLRTRRSDSPVPHLGEPSRNTTRGRMTRLLCLRRCRLDGTLLGARDQVGLFQIVREM